MTGIVDTVRVLTVGPRRGQFVFGFAATDDGRRVFVHHSRCDGHLPQEGDRIEFDIDESDPRGLFAVNVKIIELNAAPAVADFADVELVCSECRRPFLFTAGQAEFYANKRLAAPKKCGGCRFVVRARLGLPVRRPHFSSVFANQETDEARGPNRRGTAIHYHSRGDGKGLTGMIPAGKEGFNRHGRTGTTRPFR